jgi:hypothetical protein
MRGGKQFEWGRPVHKKDVMIKAWFWLLTGRNEENHKYNHMKNYPPVWWLEVKNSPNVAHACRKRRLKWALSVWGYSWATQAPEGIHILGVQLPEVMGLQH